MYSKLPRSWLVQVPGLLVHGLFSNNPHVTGYKVGPENIGYLEVQDT